MAGIPQSQGFDFDDVMIVPRLSSIAHRSEVNLETTIAYNPRTQVRTTIKYPLIAANMDTISGYTMVKAMSMCGASAFLHRYMGPEAILSTTKQLLEEGLQVIPSIGIQNHDKELVIELHKAGVLTVCLDVAHGHHQRVIEMVKELAIKVPWVSIIAGNVVTKEAAADLVEAGVAGIKLGLGSGAVCLTRTKTGVGVPQLSAIVDVYKQVRNMGKAIPIISDGGARSSGDCVKALAAGAAAVMSGYFFAGCKESEAVIKGMISKKEDESVMVEYRGMASASASTEFRGFAKNVEGKTMQVPSKGSVCNIVNDIVEGIQSGCSYVGAHNLRQLQEYSEFIMIK